LVRIVPRRGHPDLVKSVLRAGLLALRQVVQHVGRLVAPAALRPRTRPDLRKRLPEAKRSVTDRELGVGREAARLHIKEQLLPGLLALAVAVDDGQELLLATGGRAHQDQDALTLLLESDVEVDAVGPDVHDPLVREVSTAPFLEVRLPDLLEPHDRRRGEARSIRAEQRSQGFREVARGDALEVQPGNQLFDRLRPTQVRRQDRARELDATAILVDAAVVDTRAPDFDVSHARLDRALGAVTVAHDETMAGLITSSRVLRQVALDLRFQGCSEHALSAASKDLRERILRASDWLGFDERRSLLHVAYPSPALGARVSG
jgi:hypothetical protein